MKKTKIFLEAVIVITVVLALVLPSSAVVTNTTKSNDKNMSYEAYPTTLSAINKVQLEPGSFSRGEDVLVSWDNPDEDDEKPRITANTEGVIVVTYEKVNDALTRYIPISYSDDNGASWTIQFEVDSSENEYGSGILESPDVSYSPVADEFFWCAIDPMEDASYSIFTGRIPGDIANAQSMPMYIYSYMDSEDYTEGANTYVGEWMITLNVDTAHGIVGAPALSYLGYEPPDIWYTPNELNSKWAMGMYYDGQSVLETAPASKPEMTTGENRLFMVMETYDEDAGYSNISYKATYTDLDPESETFLYILGGGPSDMDKHADIEVWPWQMYIAEDAEDPDVSAQGSTVAVVYSQDGDVKCKASDDDGENWVESTVDTGAGYPCVYVACNMIYVAYVQAENLYLVKSDDLGQSWSSPDQINDESGTVVAESGTADLGVFGITWTDSRDVSYDVYFEYIELDLNNNPPGAPTITGPPKGAAGTKYDYTFTSIDPDGNQVSYYIKWGDGDITDWTAFQASGPPGYSDSHTWDEQDEYTIEAKAKDVCGAESGWATLTVTMPRNRAYINTPFLRFLQQHPNLLPILRLLFQR